MQPITTFILVIALLGIKPPDPITEAPAPRPAPLTPRPVGRVISFNRDVRPILAENCFACHGFDAKARKGKLRLDIPEGAFAERNGILPIKPGDLKQSEVWARIISQDPDLQMPPANSHKSLTFTQKETLRLWIEQGAKYQKHWSFESIVAPSVPPAWGEDLVANPIDHFILDRLRETSLKPTQEANRETLIRRVSFALTGLPPSVKEVDEFLADQSPKRP
ncbi:MAG: c-type cytochrome domain-containing protein [Gemmataceae bacterium]